MIWTTIFLAILLVAYKGLLFWMNRDLNKLRQHNRKLRRSFSEDSNVGWALRDQQPEGTVRKSETDLRIS